MQARHQKKRNTIAQSIRLSKSSHPTRCLGIETLEARRLLTTNPLLVVTVADGTGPGSLADRIQIANATAGPDRIVFDPSIQEVRPSAELLITDALTIDGENRVFINGTGSSRHGLVTVANHVEFSQLAIGNYTKGFGVVFSGVSSGWLHSSKIGTNLNGDSPRPNQSGVLVTSSSNVIIGADSSGNTTKLGNLISGNNDWGIILDANSNNNRLSGNRIGTNASGQAPLPNAYGVGLWGKASNNIIGTNADGVDDESEGNLISGNAGQGVNIDQLGTDNNIIAGNLIGTNANADAPLPNGNWTSIFIGVNTSGTRIGTDGNGIADVAERNIISGSAGHGIVICGTASKVAGNYIGLDKTGTKAIPNTYNGISFDLDAKYNVIGVDGDASPGEANERNIISGNADWGVLIYGTKAYQNRISGNIIGADAAGLAAIPNRHGVGIVDGSSKNIIGTNGDGQGDSLEGNLISGNLQHAAYLNGAGTVDNVLAGNTIGIDATGNNLLRNGSWVSVIVESQADRTRIGTNGDAVNDDVERNIISGSNEHGVLIRASDCVIAGNYIGTNASGTQAIPNAGFGIVILSGAKNNIVGTNGDASPGDANEGNLISGNNKWGIVIANTGTQWNRVAGNRIGTDFLGTSPLPNQTGILVHDGASHNIIGTDGNGISDELERNLISGNLLEAVNVSNPGTEHNVIAGNLIGVDISTNNPLPNYGWAAVLIDVQAQYNRIGTDGNGISDATEANTISGNNEHGIAISSSNNTVAGNFIGTNHNGTSGLGNNGTGVVLHGHAQSNVIGTNGDASPGDAAERNVIAANHWINIEIVSPNVKFNRIAGNFIGTNPQGTASYPNTTNVGILVYNNASDNLIGTNGDGIQDALEGNLISGASEDGIGLHNSFRNRVAGNRIGTDITGNLPIPNQLRGILVALGAQDNIIGIDGDQSPGEANEGNLISGNLDFGILLDGPNTKNNRLAGNKIGTTLSGLVALPNHGGIAAWGTASNNIIGTNGDGQGDALEGNLISGNKDAGIYIAHLGTDDQVIAGNRIGTDATGTATLPNQGWTNVFVAGSLRTRIGTNGDGISDQYESNVIVGSPGNGLTIQAYVSKVSGNFIGTDSTGTSSLGNQGNGIAILNYSTYNTIGTDADGSPGDAYEANVISGNGKTGVHISGADSTNNNVSGNFIGTDRSASIPLPNAGPGILVTDQAKKTMLGGPNAEFGNLVAFNSVGIRIDVPSTELHNFRHNRFHQNHSIAVDIGSLGHTPNDPGDTDSATNYPVITSARRTGELLIIEGFARPGAEIDLYKSLHYDNGLGQGNAFLARVFEGGIQDQNDSIGSYDASTFGTTNVGVDTTNRFRFVLPLNSLQNTIHANELITAIAAETTSEFGNTTLVIDSALSQEELGPNSLKLTNNSIAELSAVGTIVGFLSANGNELHPSWEYSYQLISGDGSQDNEAFRIVDNRLVSKKIFDFETKNTYSIRIRATDPNSRTFEKPMTISIFDAQEDGSGPYVTLASISATGIQSNNISQNPAISADGRYLAYATKSSNTNPEKSDDLYDIIRKDLLTGDTLLVSRGILGNAYYPSISADGRFVVYGSGFDLGLGDNNRTESIFVVDTLLRTTQLVSAYQFHGLSGIANQNQAPFAISADGRYVAFTLYNTPPSHPLRDGVYVKDLLTGDLKTVVQEIGASFATISPDGTHVAVSRSAGARITPGVIGYSVFNLKTGARSDIPIRTTNDTQGWQASLSGDGRYLTYMQNWEIYLFDTITGSNQRISLGTFDPADPLRTVHAAPAISIDGARVVFYSLPIINGTRYRGLVSFDVASGSSARYETTFLPSGSVSTSFTNSLAANGTKLAFYSDVSNLVPEDSNNYRDVFVIDLVRPITAISLSETKIPETSPVGSTIGTLSATDMFANTITPSYSLVSGDGSSSNSFFEIVDNILKIKRALDYESASSHSIRVRATDPQGRSYEQILTIEVLDVIERPLIIQGTNGNDAFTVTTNSSNSWTIRRGSNTLHTGSIFPATEIIIQGGNGTDTLTINGSTAADTFTIENDSITLNSIVIRQFSIESRTANGLGQNDTFFINGSIESLKGADGLDRFVFADSELTVELLDGGNGYDTLDYANRNTSMSYTVGATNAPSVTRFSTIESIIATSACDDLQGRDIPTYWGITGENTTQINNIDYVGFENLYGGTATDFFQFWNPDSRITGKIVGGDESDRITAFNRNNTWILDTDKGGAIANQVPLFEGIEILFGGPQDDTFLVSPLARFTSIDAGTGNDSIDFSNFNAPVTLSLATLSVTATGRFTSVENFIGSSGQDAITAANSANVWHLTGPSTGSINNLNFASFEFLRGGSGTDQFNIDTHGSASQILGGNGIDTVRGPDIQNTWRITQPSRGILNNKTNFQDIEHIVGGNLDDAFEILPTGRITGSLSGGAGTNSLSYRNATSSVAVNATTGVATNITSLAPNFQILIGGSGNDNLRAFPDIPTVLVGNAGNDSLTGSTKNDILIGGTGTDTLHGAGGQDILIAATTTHDVAPVALANLRTEWTSERSYTQRIENLQGTSNTDTPLNNGTYLRNTPTDTLLDDTSIDTLYGDEDLDWFIANISVDLLADRIADELSTNPNEA